MEKRRSKSSSSDLGAESDGTTPGMGPGSVRAQPRGILPEVQDEPLTEKRQLDIEAGKEFPVPVAPLPKTITPCRACHGPEKDFR